MNKQGKLIDYNRAMELFYNLQTFANLNDAETYLYFESSDYIYAMLQDEIALEKYSNQNMKNASIMEAEKQYYYN